MAQDPILDRRTLRLLDPALEAAYQRDAVAPVRREAGAGATVSIGLWLLAGVIIPNAGVMPAATSTPIVVLMALANLVVLAPIRAMRTLDDALRLLLGINVLTSVGVIILASQSGVFERYASPAMMLQAIFAVFIARRFVVSLIAASVQLSLLVAAAVALGILGRYVLDLFIVMSTLGVGVAATYVIESAARTGWHQRRTIEKQQAELAVEKEKSDRLLRNVLPDAIADRLRERPVTIAEGIDDATVLFADLVGFTPLAGRLEPKEVVGILDTLFGRFDELSDRYGLEKIKTIGDAYMAAGGVPEPLPNHPSHVVSAALGMLDAARSFARESGLPIQLRVGVHTGPVVAGVIGHRRFSYDLWGDTVNTASRMESHGVADAVQISRATRDRIGAGFTVVARGSIEVKGKGGMEAFLVTGEA